MRAFTMGGTAPIGAKGFCGCRSTLFFSGMGTFQIHAPALRRNAGSIILHPNPYVFFFFSGCNPDLGSCLCIFYCIVDQVYQYLYNQLCIHAGEQYIFPAVHRNFYVRFSAVLHGAAPHGLHPQPPDRITAVLRFHLLFS